MKYGNELDKVLAHLLKEGRIKLAHRKNTRGPVSEGYEVVEDAQEH
jgi:hypothetical protein